MYVQKCVHKVRVSSGGWRARGMATPGERGSFSAGSIGMPEGRGLGQDGSMAGRSGGGVEKGEEDDLEFEELPLHLTSTQPQMGPPPSTSNSQSEGQCLLYS